MIRTALCPNEFISHHPNCSPIIVCAPKLIRFDSKLEIGRVTHYTNTFNCLINPFSAIPFFRFIVYRALYVAPKLSNRACRFFRRVTRAFGASFGSYFLSPRRPFSPNLSAFPRILLSQVQIQATLPTTTGSAPAHA